MATMYIELVDGKILNARVKQKTGPQSDFAGYTLLDGEIALVRSSPTGPVIQFKVGPGVFDDLDWSLPSPGAAQKADTSTVFPAGVPGLYIPIESGTIGGVPVDLSAGYTQLIWDGANLVDVVFPIDLAGYATTGEVDMLKNMVGSTSPLPYSGALPFREYTTPTVFNEDNPNFSQVNNADSDQFTLSASATGLPVLYIDTGITIDNNRKMSWSILVNDIISAGFSVGIGVMNSGNYAGIMYRSGGDVIFTNPFTASVVQSGLSTFSEGDTVSFEIEKVGAETVFTYYVNGQLSGTYVRSSLLNNTLQIAMRGRGTFTVRKISYVEDKYASKGSVSQLSSQVAQLNPNEPFHFDATFSGFEWIRNAILDVKVFGANPNAKISPYIFRRNFTGGSTPVVDQWLVSFWMDTGDGSGTDRVLFVQWGIEGYTEPPSGEIDVVDFRQGGVGFKLYIDWDQVPAGQTIGMSYNIAGLSKQALINFSTGATPPAQEAGVSWHYNDDDAPVTGTDQFAQFTVVPNVDGDNDTVGCTGASYNPDTEEYVISYYSYAKAAELWMYKRQDLVPYSPSGTIVPVPTRKINVSSHIYHIQGNVYDAQLKSYWILGAENPVSSDAERLLIRVDDEGNLLERYSLSAYSFQAGMIALSPDGQNLMIKPNNQTWLLEINKFTKSQVRQVTTATAHEGLAVDALKSLVWVGGNDGNLYVYDYTTMVLQDTIAYETLPDGGTMNVEGMIIDPIDGAVIIVADAYLHGANNNGNCMWVFDFDKTIGKQVRFPDMMPWQGNESMVVDFGSSNDLVAAVLESGTGTIQYRGSNTAPTIGAITRTNWRDRPYYGSWGSTSPSAWSSNFTAYRYMQLRII